MISLNASQSLPLFLERKSIQTCSLSDENVLTLWFVDGSSLVVRSSADLEFEYEMSERELSHLEAYADEVLEQNEPKCS